MREYVTLQCRDCKSQNYRTSKETRAAKKLELKKHCTRCRRHTVHVERKR